MKKSVLILKGALIILLYLGPYLTLNGQSEKVIFLNSGDQIQFNKLKWKQGRISYTDLDNSQKLLNYDDVNFIVNNKKVVVIYKRGGTNVFGSGRLIMDFKDIDPESICTEGMLDGMKNSFTGAKIGGGITGFLIPIGLIGTAIIGSSAPQQSKLNFPVDAQMNNPIYMDCYMKSAKAQKKFQTWQWAGIGASVALLIVSISLSSY
jgi:hypothetical protein